MTKVQGRVRDGGVEAHAIDDASIALLAGVVHHRRLIGLTGAAKGGQRIDQRKAIARVRFIFHEALELRAMVQMPTHQDLKV